MPTRSLLRSLGVLLIAGAFAAPSFAGPARLPILNPLAEPAPLLAEPLVEPIDQRPADRKVLGGLWLKVSPSEVHENTLRVIITLHEPTLQSMKLQTSNVPEAVRLQAIAALEHQFVREAAVLGFQAEGGLSHFPIVFGEVPTSRLLNVAELPWVAAVEEQRTYQVTRTEGSSLMRADRLRSFLGGYGQGIGVGVLDSGIDIQHPELQGHVVAGADYTQTTPWNGFVDDNGHGTSVAGIIGGSSGIAPQAGLWSGKVLTAAGQGQDTWILGALNSFYAARNDFGGLRIINMSLGGGGPFSSDCDGLSSAYTNLFNALNNVGILVFVASGNEGCAGGVSFPACHSRVISVGAVYDGAPFSASFPQPSSCRPAGCSDPAMLADGITCYSNSGAPLDVLAPSHCAHTPSPGGAYNSCFGGTSAAAPYAAGVAAQILSLRPSTTPAEVAQAMMSTGRSLTDPRNGLVRKRLDAVSAYEYLAGTSNNGPCTPDASTLCIDDQPGDRRFKAQVSFQTTLGGGRSGFGQAIPLGSIGVGRGGLFWFFGSDNPEMLIKVLNGCGVNGRYWIFFSAGTSVGFTVKVTDTYSGVVWERTNPDLVAAPSVQDTHVFACSSR